MERDPRYHELISPRIKAFLGDLLFGRVDISPNEVNKPAEPTRTPAEQAVDPLQGRLALDVEDLRWEAQQEAWDENNK